MSKTARVFEDVGGYYVCDDDGTLYTDGKAYPTKASALRGAHHNGYTHAIGSGTYWDGIKRIPAQYREE